MQKWASKIDIIQDQQEIHDSLLLVPDGTLLIAALGRPKTGGFRCTFVSEDSTTVSTCRYVGTSLKRIRQHLKDEHEWDLELKAGRRSAAMAEQERSNNPWRSGVLYQRFFLMGPRSEYFEVARGLNLDGLRSEDHVSQVRLQQAIDAFQRKGNDVRSQEAGRIDAENDFTAPNPWLRRLGSSLHLKDFSGKKDFLKDLISMEYEVDPNDPDESDDAQLRLYISHSIEWSTTPKPSSHRIPSLGMLCSRSTARSLSRSGPSRFISGRRPRPRGVIRLWLNNYLPRLFGVSFEDKAVRPPFKLSRRQQNAYDIMMVHADDLTVAWKDHGGDPEVPEISRLLDLLESDVLELYISVLDHFTKDTEYDSVLVSFLTVLSVRADDTWEGYANFTPQLSSLQPLCVSQVLE